VIGSPALAWLIENLVWASAAMLLVLVIRRPVARHLGAGVAYALWLVPALRLIAPPAEWVAQIFATPLPSLPPILVTIEAAGEAAPPSVDGPGQWVPILLAVWAGGAILFLILQALAYRRFTAQLSGSAHSAGSHRGLPLIESAAVEGPLALGLLNRRIVVPAGFEDRYSPAERQLALDHERYHHRRGDILANHAALIVLALNWFNPIAWASFRAFRADQELSCDAVISAQASPEARSDYARALVKSASRPGLIAACPLNRADQLKRRLKMLNHHKKDRRRLWAGSALTCALVLTSMATGQAGFAQPPADDAASQAVRQREADTNRALLTTLVQRRAEVEKAPKGADTRAEVEFIDRRIEQTQDRIAKQESDREREGRHRVIILENEKGSAAPTGERRELRIRRGADGRATVEGLDPELNARLERCESEQGVLNVDTGDNKERTRILVCAKNGANPANRLQVLQGVRERISGQSDLSAETKQRILAEIDRAIAGERGN